MAPLFQVSAGEGELGVEGFEVDLSGLIKACAFKGEVAGVPDFFDMAEKAIKVDMAFAQLQDFEIIPVHVSPSVVVHMVVADVVFLPEPGVFGGVEEVQLAVEVRHLGIEDEKDLRIGFVQLDPVGHGIPVADNVFDQQGQAVILCPLVQLRPGPEVVLEMRIGNKTVPQVQDHLLRADGFGEIAVNLKKAEGFLQFLLPAPGNVLRKGFLTVEDGDMQLQALEESRDLRNLRVPGVIEDKLKAIAFQLRAECF